NTRLIWPSSRPLMASRRSSCASSAPRNSFRLSAMGPSLSGGVMVPPPLRETPERAVRERADAAHGVPDGVPARAMPQVREERMNADFGLRLIVEDFHAAVLQHRRGVIRDLLEWITVVRMTQSVADREIVSHIQEGQQRQGADQDPRKDEE